MVNEKTPTWRHQITLVDREELTVEGVNSLGSYDRKGSGNGNRTRDNDCAGRWIERKAA